MRKTILWLFVVALISRAIIALLQITYGINSQVNLDQYLYGAFNPGFELYHDFYAYYVTQLQDLNKGLIPYSDFGYSYAPLFLYVLYPFFAVGGKYAASIPILLADAASSPIIYLIVSKFASNRISVLAGISYGLSPFFLLYEGYLWYSSQPMTFFILLSLYLLIVEKPLFSAAIFAFAVLFKQEIIFILPVYLVWYVKSSKKTIWKGLVTICCILLAVSLPFLLISPGFYITSLSYGTIGHYYPSIDSSNLTNPSIYAAITSIAPTLNCTSISNTSRSLICNYGAFSYTDVKSIPPLSTILSAAFLNSIALWITLPLIGLVSYYAFLLRRDNKTLLVAGAISQMVFITIFDVEIHSIYRYYLVPVYALMLASSDNRFNLFLAAIVPIGSLFLPSGSIQLVPPLFCILGILVRRYVSSTSLPTTPPLISRAQ
jgi:hypothetical protein